MGEKANTGVNPKSATSDGAKTYVESTHSNSSGIHEAPEKIQNRRDYIMHLQRTIGNQAVGRLLKSGWLQKKLNIGPANDKYELEADAVSEKVVSMNEPENNSANETSGDSSNEISAKSAPAPATISRTPLVNSIMPLQRSANESTEELQEKQPDDDEKLQGNFLQKSGAPGEDEEAQGKSLQREAAPEDEEAQGKFLQRESASEEEEAQGKLLQREAAPEDEDAQGKFLQRVEEDDEGQAKLQRVEEEEEGQAKLQRVEEDDEGQAKLRRKGLIPPKIPGGSRLPSGVNQAYVQKKRKEYTAPENTFAAGKSIHSVRTLQKKTLWTPPSGVGVLQRKGNGQAAPEGVESSINSARGGGKSLSPNERSYYEPRFGADFSGVKIHTGGQANQLSKSVNAKAFTVGSDIFFGSGQYNQDTSDGKKLMAHELTHTVQQGSSLKRKTTLEPGAEEEEKKTDSETVTEQNLSPSTEKGQGEGKLDQSTSPDVTNQEKDQTSETTPDQNSKTELEKKPELKSEPESLQPDEVKDSEDAVLDTKAKAEVQPEAGQTEKASPEMGSQNVSPEASKKGGKGAKAPDLKAEKPALKAENPGDVTKAISLAPATEALDMYNQGVSQSQGLLEKEVGATESNLPKMKTPTGLAPEEPTVKPKHNYKTAKAPGSFKGEKKGKKGDPNHEILKPKKIKAKQGFWSRMGSFFKSVLEPTEAKAAINSVKLDTGKIPSKLGARPGVNLSGEADPNQAEAFQSESKQNVAAAKQESHAQANQDFGENSVAPVPDNTIIQAKKKMGKTAVSSQPLEAPQLVPPEVKGDIDVTMGATLRPALLKEESQYSKERQTYEAGKVQAETDTDAQAEALNEETKATQRKEQQNVKAQVDGHRQEWKDEVGKVEKDFETKSSKATIDQKAKISQESAKGNKEADQHFKKAENDAAQKKRDASKDAEKEKSKGKKESTGFFSWVGSKLSAFVDGIKNAVNAIFDGLKKAVSFIFDAAKKLAMAAIDLARKAVTGLIKGLGTLLKGLISVVFAAFPEIAKKINAKIDATVNKAVKAVNDAAAALKKGVAKLLDVLASVINGLLSAVQAAYNFALTAMSLIVKGEFKQLGKYIVKSALKLLGATLGALMKLMGISQKDVDRIVDDPIGFLGNLVGAVKKGLNQFVSNIVKHLTAGLASWLFGAFGKEGIQLPTSFNLPGIFSFLAQLFHLTYDAIRNKLIKKIGSAGATIVKAFEGGFAFMVDFAKRGPLALWEKVEKSLTNIKEMLFGSLITWLRNTIIVQAVTKLVSFFNPAGAIVQAVQAIYNVAMFFKERWDQIKSFGQAVFQSFSNIAKGAVGTAAGFIEKSIGKAIPIMIAFLARLLNISGVVKQVKGVIDKIRKPISKAVKKVVGWLAKMAKKAWKGLKKIGGKLLGKGKDLLGKLKQWWKVKLPIKAKGEQHTLFFSGNNESAVLMIASKGMRYESFIKTLRPTTDEQQAAKEKALNLGKQIDMKKKEVASLHRKYKDPKKDAGIKAEADKKQLNMVALMKKMTNHISILLQEKKIPEKRFLPPKFKMKVRKKLYMEGSGYSTLSEKMRQDKADDINEEFKKLRKETNENKKEKIWMRLLDAELVPDNVQRDAYVRRNIKKRKLNVDHVVPLAKHWITIGWNTSDEERQKHASSASNFEVIHEQHNKSKGSQDEDGYKHYYKDRFWVGKKFSSMVNKSPFSSLKIGKEFFRETLDGKPIKR
ncbi:MAG: DUF4157 domain-containing protein [Leptospirales bacterium]